MNGKLISALKTLKLNPINTQLVSGLHVREHTVHKQQSPCTATAMLFHFVPYEWNENYSSEYEEVPSALVLNPGLCDPLSMLVKLQESMH